MLTYLDALERVMTEGTDRPDRTGTGTRSLFGMQMEFDLTKGFPAVTTKKLAFKQVVGELLGFVRGIDNAAEFRELGCTIWDENAAAPYWQDSPECKGVDDLGRIYGVQWRRWKMDILEYGASYEFDQLSDVIERIKIDPYDRRLIVSAWNAAEIADNRMALPPCHVMFQFYVRPKEGLLDLKMYQRSADMFLGVPFNIASYSLLLHIVAHLTGYKAGRFIHTLGDAHIYSNHFGQVEEQLGRTCYNSPEICINHKEKLEDYTPSDFELINYRHWPALRAPMAV